MVGARGTTVSRHAVSRCLRWASPALWMLRAALMSAWSRWPQSRHRNAVPARLPSPTCPQWWHVWEVCRGPCPGSGETPACRRPSPGGRSRRTLGSTATTCPEPASPQTPTPDHPTPSTAGTAHSGSPSGVPSATPPAAPPTPRYTTPGARPTSLVTVAADRWSAATTPDGPGRSFERPYATAVTAPPGRDRRITLPTT